MLRRAPALRLRGLDAPAEQAIAAALVVARMVHPSSEYAAHAWLAGSSATLELLGLERAKPLSLSKLYRTSDLLWKHREALETALAQRERSLFDTPEAIVFYDLTNVHYHGRPAPDGGHGRGLVDRGEPGLAARPRLSVDHGAARPGAVFATRAGPQGLHEALRQGTGTAGTAQGTLPAGSGAV